MSFEVPDAVIWRVRCNAASGMTTGRDHIPSEHRYVHHRCTYLHYQTGTLLIFTRDTGHHSSGWFKNPDYERCLHLSLSFRQPYPERDVEQLGSPRIIEQLGGHVPLAPYDSKLADIWVRAILGEAHKLAWCEGPFSAQGKQLNVHHWRVFCDLGWQPIHPRGEVYTRDFTSKGWKSWSDLHAEPNWVSAQ